jgi:Zn-dependent protease with chaperone function
MFGNIFGQYLGNLKEFPRSEAREIYKFVEESSRKLGITHPITLLHSDSPLPNMMMFEGKSNKGLYTRAIIITDGAKKLLNDQEIKAVVGHELSHLKDGKFLTQTARKLPIFALPLAFATGYYILDRAYREQQKPEHSGMSLMEAVRHVVSEDVASVKHFVTDGNFGLTPDSKSKETKNITEEKAALYETGLRLGGTVAAAAAGLAVGLGVSRHLSLSSEFRADRIGALLAGDPKSSISAISKLMYSMEETMSNQKFYGSFVTTSRDTETAIGNLLRRLNAYYKQELQMLDLEYFHAHPTLPQRAKALQSIPAESFQKFIEKSRVDPLLNLAP